MWLPMKSSTTSALLARVAAQAAAELLQEQDLGLGGPEHHDGVDGRQVHALVEQVHREDHLQVAALQLLQGRAAVQADPA